MSFYQISQESSKTESTASLDTRKHEHFTEQTDCIQEIEAEAKTVLIDKTSHETQDGNGFAIYSISQLLINALEMHNYLRFPPSTVQS